MSCVWVTSANAAAQLRPLVAEGGGAEAVWAQLSLSSRSLWVLTVKSTADLGHILHPEVAFKSLQIPFGKQMVFPQSE